MRTHVRHVARSGQRQSDSIWVALRLKRLRPACDPAADADARACGAYHFVNCARVSACGPRRSRRADKS